MKSTVKVITVLGKEYKVWSDYVMRATYAEDETGCIKMIKSSGYLKNELSVRKAIAATFGLESFRK